MKKIEFVKCTERFLPDMLSLCTYLMVFVVLYAENYVAHFVFGS